MRPRRGRPTRWPPRSLRGSGRGRRWPGSPPRSASGSGRLRRRSLDAFGYGPRTLGRILRLRRALALAGAGMPYAEVAHTAGYADQAHLAREVRALAGTTLTAYAAGSAGAKRDTPQPSGSSTTA